MTLSRRKSDSDKLTAADSFDQSSLAKLSTGHGRSSFIGGRRRRAAFLLIFLVCVGFLAGFCLIFTEFFDETTLSRSLTEEPQLSDGESLSRPMGHRRLQADRLQSYQSRLEELSGIKASVLRELRSLEQKRHQLRSEITTVTAKLEFYQSAFERKEKELDQLKSSIEQAKLTKREALEQDTPVISAPKDFTPVVAKPMSQVAPPSMESTRTCSMENCFDHSRCSILSSFPVFIHQRFIERNLSADFLINSHYVTDHMERSCAFLVPIWMSSVQNYAEFKAQLTQLPSWGGDGRNHILLPLYDAEIKPSEFYEVISSIPSRAILATPFVDPMRFRQHFDLPVFPFAGKNYSTLEFLPSLSPARRKFLLSFWAEPFCRGGSVGQLIKGLRQLQLIGQKTKDKFYFSFSCSQDRNFTSMESTDLNEEDDRGCWSQCEIGPNRRADLLKDSTFTLIPVVKGVITPTALTSLMEAVKFGAIPVFLGDKSVELRLPFGEIVGWKSAGLFLPAARLPELHFLLRTFVDSHLIQLRTSGRRAYQLFLSSNERIFETLLAVMRTRLNIPPRVAEDFVAETIFNATFQPKTTEMPYLSETDEFLGPVELPYDSPKFGANFSAVTSQVYETWNSGPYPFALFPNDPVAEKLLPSEAKFTGSNYGFRPINAGSGGSGKEFSESLGGNIPREQFTIVMLTYEREEVLVSSLQRLNNLPYLNKVVVVWNSPKLPSAELVWPKLNVEVVVVNPGRNSLNNRFLPYDVIKTEAILSLDDDAHLRHDEIIFGFRVWREARERIVGFPGRFHAWDAQNRNWLYNSNHSCELSMVLTGAAFFHKYYSYVYSHYMPESIRLKVDELINCEDIAMNFLVSHITRSPPLKVTSRWTFRCPGCPESLSSDDSHFFERHECINFFSKVYGYNPLLFTQFRVDSVLFKTRLPHNHQKCFKFI